MNERRKKKPEIPATPEKVAPPPERVIVASATPVQMKSNRRQLISLVVDNSGSMEGEKLDALNAAMNELVSTFADPSNRDAFDVAITTFATQPRTHLAPTRATALTPDATRVALAPDADGTNITAALNLARQVVERTAREGRYAYRPGVILLTDGAHTASSSPMEAADVLKAHATVFTVAFGTDADLDLLGKIASQPTFSVRCNDAASLRTHFASVATTMSIARMTGQDIASLLGASGGK